MRESNGFRMVKLSDIAKELNISTVSVSNALNGKKGVSEELRMKILDTAEELGYQRTIHEPDKKKQTQLTIGVVISERYIKQNGLSFYMRMYQELVLAASGKNALTLLEVLSRENEEKFMIPDLLYNDNVDGIIILGEMKHPYTGLLKKNSRKPIIFLDYYEDIPDTDFIISDGYNGMYSMTRVLIRAGYKKIGFVSYFRRTSSITDRYLGYRKAIQESGLELRKDWFIDMTKTENMRFEIELPKELPEAFVCHNDLAAKALIEKLRSEGMRIPEDIGVVGFDNYLVDDIEGITLTTYNVDVRAMAQISVNTLTRKLKYTRFVPRLRVVEGNVVIGNSHRTIKE